MRGQRELVQFSPPWNLDRLDAVGGQAYDEKYDDAGADGHGALVYMLDSGVYTAHRYEKQHAYRSGSEKHRYEYRC